MKQPMDPLKIANLMGQAANKKAAQPPKAKPESKGKSPLPGKGKKAPKPAMDDDGDYDAGK